MRRIVCVILCAAIIGIMGCGGAKPEETNDENVLTISETATPEVMITAAPEIATIENYELETLSFQGITLSIADSCAIQNSDEQLIITRVDGDNTLLLHIQDLGPTGETNEILTSKVAYQQAFAENYVAAFEDTNILSQGVSSVGGIETIFVAFTATMDSGRIPFVIEAHAFINDGRAYELMASYSDLNPEYGIIIKDAIETITVDVPESDDSKTQEYGEVIGKDINMREGPDTAYGIVRKVSEPQKALILSKEKNWYKVDVDGNEGYLREDFLLLPGQTRAPTITETSAPSVTHEPNPEPEPVSTPEIKSSRTVYWVANGEVYHYSKGCRSLARSSNIKSGNIEESKKSRGCKNCT